MPVPGGAKWTSSRRSFTTPREDDLRLTRIANRTGLSISLLPNGAIFAIEHARDQQRIMINQVLGSPIAGGMGRLYLRTGGPEPMMLPVIGPEAPCRIGGADDRFIWRGEQNGLSHQVCLWLHPDSDVWFWRVDVENRRREELPLDAVLHSGSRSWRTGLPDGQRGLREPVHRSLCRSAPHHERCSDEPAKPVAARRAPLDRARLSRRGRRFCHRLPGCDGRRTPRRGSICPSFRRAPPFDSAPV